MPHSSRQGLLLSQWVPSSYLLLTAAKRTAGHCAARPCVPTEVPRVHSNMTLHAQEPVHPLACELGGHAMGEPFSFSAQTPAMLLTDDFNLMGLRDLWMKEDVRRNILETSHPDILLG